MKLDKKKRSLFEREADRRQGGVWCGVIGNLCNNKHAPSNDSRSICRPLHLLLSFAQRKFSFCEEEMMFTQRILEHESFYSLKVLAHFRSKRTGGFSPHTIHRFNVSLARCHSKTCMTKRIYVNCTLPIQKDLDNK
jgi:hypothetical protein